MLTKRPADAQREPDAFKQLGEAQKEKRETDRRDLLRASRTSVYETGSEGGR